MRLSVAALVVVVCSVNLHCGEPAPATTSRLAQNDAPNDASSDAPRPPAVPPRADAGSSGAAEEEGPTWLSSGRPVPPAARANEAGAADAEAGARCRQDLAKSRWVSCNDDGTLRYAVDRSTGAVLPETSRVGYRGGDAPLPELPVHQVLAPSGGDDTALLQAAINAVSARPADANGWRGRLVLAPGVFRVNRTLLVAKNGVVVEGTASVGPQATTVKVTGSATVLFYVRGSGNAVTEGDAHVVARLPVPAGRRQLNLTATDGQEVGETVRITSTRNAAWISKKWGGAYPPERDGTKQAAWGEQLAVQVPRQIVSIDGPTVTLDAPLPDTLPAMDEAVVPVTVQKLNTAGYVREFGFRHLRLAGRFVPGRADSRRLLTAFVVENAEDGFIDDVEATDFGASTVALGAWTRHITVQDVRTVRSGEQTGSAKPFDISLRGQLHLVQGCASDGNRTFYVATQTTDAAGPNVVQNYRARGTGSFAPHQRWSTGLLLDNVYVPDGAIAFADRGTMGTGQGWSMGFGAAYNSLAGTHNAQPSGMDTLPGHTIDQPPGAANWGIGLVGPNRSAAPNDAHLDSPGKPVGPASLWVQQLTERRGAEGLKQVMGPWHLRDAADGQCVAVDVAQAGAYVVLRDCHERRQLALWDITSRGSLRLGGTALCLDADNDRRNTPARLGTCAEDGEQHWSVTTRGGAVTEVALQTKGTDEDACLGLDSKLVVMGDCDGQSARWRLVATHLAR